MASKTTYITEIELGAKTSSSFHTNIKFVDESLEKIQQASRNVARSAKGLNKVDAAATKAGKAILAVGTAAVAGAGVAIAKAEETYKGFEQEMANVSSISKATRSEYAMLKASALDAGSKTVYTAQESAQALEYMSLAGWDVNTSTTALMPVLKMAAATNKELGTTSDLITDSMGALKLQVGDLGSYMDMLISANNNSNTSAEQLMQALIKTGGAARTVGADLPDTITALGVLANNGTKAEEAGTAVNSMLTRIASNSTAIKTLDKIGVSLYDNGKFIGLKNALAEINKATEGMTDEKKAQTLAGIAGTRRYSLMTYLLNSVKEDAKTGISAWDELEGKITSSKGALDQMYATNTDTLKMAEAQLNSAKEDMQIRVTDVFADDQKEFVKWMANEIPKATDAIVEFAEAHEGEFADALESAGEAVEKFAVGGMQAAAWVVDNKTAVFGALKGIAGGIITIKTAMAGVNLVKTIGSLGLGPVAALTSLASAAVTAGYAIKGMIDNANEQAAADNLAEHFGKIKLSMEEIDSLARQIVGEESLAGVAAVMEATSNAADSLDAATKGFGGLQKESWKINVGFKMDQGDYKQYGSDLESYVKSVEKYAEDKGYQVHVATSLLFGDGSDMDRELNSTFASLQSEIEKAGDQLYDYMYNDVNGALLDGVIDIDEDKVIQEYIDHINSMVKKMSAADVAAKFDMLDIKYGGQNLDPETMKKLQKDLDKTVKETKEGAESALSTELQAIETRRQTDGSYTASQAAEDKKKAEVQYHNLISQSENKAANYVMDTMQGNYPNIEASLRKYEEEYSAVINKYSDMGNAKIVEGWQYSPDQMIDQMNNELLNKIDGMMDKTDRNALKDYAEALKPIAEELQSEIDYYNSVGEELPDRLKETNDQVRAFISVVGGTYKSTSDDLAKGLRDNGAFQKLVNKYDIEIGDSYRKVQQKIDSTYGNGFDVSTDVRMELNLNPKMNGFDRVQDAMNKAQEYFSNKTLKAKGITVENDAFDIDALKKKNKKASGVPYIAQNAEGGIYDKPLLTTFAEVEPEAAIPINKSRRARALWEETGRRIGAINSGKKRKTLSNAANYFGIEKSESNISRPRTGGKNNSVQLVYSPNITIKGNASQENIQKALSISKDEIRQMLEEIQSEDERVSLV